MVDRGAIEKQGSSGSTSPIRRLDTLDLGALQLLTKRLICHLVPGIWRCWSNSRRFIEILATLLFLLETIVDHIRDVDLLRVGHSFGLSGDHARLVAEWAVLGRGLVAHQQVLLDVSIPPVSIARLCQEAVGRRRRFADVCGARCHRSLGTIRSIPLLLKPLVSRVARRLRLRTGQIVELPGRLLGREPCFIHLAVITYQSIYQYV